VKYIAHVAIFVRKLQRGLALDSLFNMTGYSSATCRMLPFFFINYLLVKRDYTGGNLSISIFLASLLKLVPHAFIEYVVLLNTALFVNVEKLNAT
jgi:hypothetical protein